MPLHFTTEELAERRQRACAEMKGRGLDAMLLFRQESMYYVTGYDTFGYVYFQCLVLTAEGRIVLLTRAPDLRQARCSRRMRCRSIGPGSGRTGSMRAATAPEPRSRLTGWTGR